jgi:SAM-dependent methyltransferase
MPYPDEYFDFVYGNQSAEHWFEYGVTFEKALSEISRVMKQGAPLHLNLPVHLHGNKLFLKGRVDEFVKKFDLDAWEVVCVEEWRKNPSPLPSYAPWKNSIIMSSALWPMKPASAWILNVKVKKRSTLKLGPLEQLKSAVARLPSRIMPARLNLMLHYGPVAIAKLALSLTARPFTRRPPAGERVDDHD